MQTVVAGIKGVRVSNILDDWRISNMDISRVLDNFNHLVLRIYTTFILNLVEMFLRWCIIIIYPIHVHLYFEDKWIFLIASFFSKICLFIFRLIFFFQSQTDQRAKMLTLEKCVAAQESVIKGQAEKLKEQEVLVAAQSEKLKETETRSVQN